MSVLVLHAVFFMGKLDLLFSFSFSFSLFFFRCMYFVRLEAMDVAIAKKTESL